MGHAAEMHVFSASWCYAAVLRRTKHGDVWASYRCWVGTYSAVNAPTAPHNSAPFLMSARVSSIIKNWYRIGKIPVKDRFCACDGMRRPIEALHFPPLVSPVAKPGVRLRVFRSWSTPGAELERHWVRMASLGDWARPATRCVTSRARQSFNTVLEGALMGQKYGDSLLCRKL